MLYNTTENLQYCSEIVNEVFSLLTYSHLFPIIACVVSLALVLYSSSNNLIKKLFTAVSLSFILWVLSNLAIWLFFDNNQIMMFAWSSIEFFGTLVFLYLLYFIYVLIYEEDAPSKFKWTWLALILPLVIFGPTQYNLVGIDLAECIALEKQYYLVYSTFVKSVFAIWLVVLLMKASFRNKDKKRAITLAGIGATVFFLSFVTMGFLASLTGNYNLEFYGLFGMIFFVVFLALAVNRYKIINVRIISTEFLVLAIILMVSSQFLYLQNTLAFTLNIVTFLLVSVLGSMLIRNIKKEIESKEIIKKTAFELREANQNQQSLLHFITHQVKGYMATSRNIFSGLLEGDYGLISDKIKEVTHHGLETQTRGVETVLAILSASDLKSGKTTLRKATSNLSKLVAEVVEKEHINAQKKNLELTFEIDENIQANVDPVRIGEVFKNLIKNAIAYTVKGTVHVTLKKEDHSIRFAVVDTGIGLTEEDKKRLFTEGGKGEDSLNYNIDSTGYGLFIAKKIVDQHQGRIGAHSHGRGTGSEFFVILPHIE